MFTASVLRHRVPVSSLVLNQRGFARKRKPFNMPVPKFEKRLDCVIFGLPNVGKSVLLNSLVKQKLAATSRKRQTTRGEIQGVFNHRNTQLVFYDTPGYIAKSADLKKEMQVIREKATSTLVKSDVVLLVVDAARRIDHNARYLFGEMTRLAVKSAKKEIILVLNKVDLVNPKRKLLEITREYISLINGVKLGPENAHLAQLDTTTFMVSATENDGVLDIKNYLIQIADMKPWMLSKEEGFTTMSKEERVEEIILESFLDHVHEEIPYIAKIKCTKISQHSTRTGSVAAIEVDILLDNVRQRKIVLGHQGQTLLRIRQDACSTLEPIFGCLVILKFDIKVRKEKAQLISSEEQSL